MTPDDPRPTRRATADWQALDTELRELRSEVSTLRCRVAALEDRACPLNPGDGMRCDGPEPDLTPRTTLHDDDPLPTLPGYDSFDDPKEQAAAVRVAEEARMMVQASTPFEAPTERIVIPGGEGGC